jgi:hypothetical protein
LSYGGRVVGHDTAVWCDVPEDFVVNLDAGMVGVVETGAMMGWRLIKELLPKAKFAVIKRPVAEVKRSLSQFGVVAAEGELEAKSKMLDAISSHPGVLTVTFAELYDVAARKALFEHCLGVEFDPQWDTLIAHRNIQIDVFERMRNLAQRRGAIERLKLAVA